MENKVSIRCRRHHKRIEVEQSWLKTCSWLCPHCYNLLSKTEREKYAPKSAPKKVSKITTPRTKKKDKEDTIERGLIGNFLDKKKKRTIEKSVEVSPEVNEIEANISRILNEPKELRLKRARECEATPGFKKEFEKLKPKYKVHCLKCGQDYPCFSFWLDKSKVLCPECASDMTEQEIQNFNRTASSKFKTVNTQFGMSCDSDPVASGRQYSENFIHKASVRELIEAVNKGKVSKVRAKIELRRRMKSQYYDELPENHGVEFGSI